MSHLWEQIHALRTPPEIRVSQGEELHHHINENVIPFLERIPPEMLVQHDDKSISDPLGVLSAREDTLPYLYTLTAQINAAAHSWKEKFMPKALEPEGQLWKRITAFITQFDPIEIRYAGRKWLELMDLFDRVSRGQGNMTHIVRLMAYGMLRLDPSAGTFTSTHLRFVSLCLRTRSLQESRMILDLDIYSLPPLEIPSGFPCSAYHLSNGYITQNSGLTQSFTLTDILQYYLEGAMVYIGMHRWERASYFLEHVLSTPTNNTANGLMLEAYKKWVLVALLEHGKVPALPKAANAQAMKSIRSASKAYDGVAEAFKSSVSAKLNAEAQEGDSVWKEDANEGLVRHVLEHHRKLSVVRLGNLYAAVPISEICNKLGSSSKEAEEYIGMLIKQGLLSATLEPSKSSEGESIVKFIENASDAPVARSEEQLRFELMKQTRQIKALADHLNEADRRLSLSKEYLDHTRRSRKADIGRTSPEHDTDMLSELGVHRQALGSDEEENVMTDVG